MPGWYDLIPTPQAVLWFMAAFLLAWGLSVLPRAVTRTRGLRCPACGEPMKPEHGTRCPACLNDAATEANLHDRRRRPSRFAVGVLAIVAGTTAAMGAVYVERFVRHGSLALSDSGAWHAAATGLSAFAVVLAAWAYRGDRSRGRRRCPKCWYSMAATAGQCPECGYTSDSDRAWYHPRRRLRTAGVAAILVVLSLALFSTPRVLRVGWAGAIPTTVLIAFLPWLPDRLLDPRFNVSANFGALSHRVGMDELWEWQERWLRRRAAGLVAGAPAVDTLLRTTPFLNPNDIKPVAAALLIHQAELLASPDPAVRQGAMDQRYFAWRIGLDRPIPELEPLRSGLLAAIDDPRSDVRGAAAAAMGFLPTLTPREASRLTGAFEDQSWVQSAAYATLLAHLGRSPDAVVPALIASLDPAGFDPDPASARARSAMLALELVARAGKLPMHRDGARERILEVARSGHPTLAFAAVEALARAQQRPLDPDTASAVLAALLVRELAERQLVPAVGVLGTLTDDQIVAVVGAGLRSTGTEVRAAAISVSLALVRARPSAALLLLDDLERCAGDATPYHAREIRAAVESLRGPTPPPTAPPPPRS